MYLPYSFSNVFYLQHAKDTFYGHQIGLKLLTKRGHNFEQGKEVVSRIGKRDIEFPDKISTKKKHTENTKELSIRISKLADTILPATEKLIGKLHPCTNYTELFNVF
jgi:hypothetical protein